MALPLPSRHRRRLSPSQTRLDIHLQHVSAWCDLAGAGWGGGERGGGGGGSAAVVYAVAARRWQHGGGSTAVAAAAASLVAEAAAWQKRVRYLMQERGKLN